MHFDGHVFGHYLWPPTALADPTIRFGLLATVYIAVGAQLLGMLIGTVLAVGRMSRLRAVQSICLAYVTYIRGTPLLVQIFLIYYGFAELGIARFGDSHLFGWTLPGVAVAGILALGINKGAYVAEIMRAAFSSVDAGQWEASQALGLPRRRALRYIVFPQAIRIAVPGLGNEFNAVLKDTSLLVLIGGVELFHAFQKLNGQLFLPFELYLAMSFYFLALTGLWSIAQYYLERRLGRGFIQLTSQRRPRLGHSLWRTS